MSPSSPLFPFFPAIFRIFLFLFPLFLQHAMRVTPNYGGFLLLFPLKNAQKNYPLYLYPGKGRRRRNCASRASSSYFLFCSFFPHDIRQTDLGRSGAQITNCLLHPPLFVCGKLVLRPQRFKKSPFFDRADSKGAASHAHPTRLLRKGSPFLCNAADTSCKSVLLSEL